MGKIWCEGEGALFDESEFFNGVHVGRGHTTTGDPSDGYPDQFGPLGIVPAADPEDPA